VILARVVGNCVSSVQHPSFDGRTVLVLQPVATDTHTPLGGEFMAVDAAQAGPGDLVLAAREGNTARQVLGAGDEPLHAVVIGVVDEVHLGAPAGGA
jgi:microcompartment protein CcmK/EutM